MVQKLKLIPILFLFLLLVVPLVSAEAPSLINGNLNLPSLDSEDRYALNTGDSLTGSYLFNGGWENDGCSIITGDIYCQTGHFGNITYLELTKQNLTVNDRLFVQGDVGIGVTSPVYKLDVNGTFAKRYFTGNVWNNFSITSGYELYGDAHADGGYKLYLQWGQYGWGGGGHDLVFGTKEVPAITIDEGARIGIGTNDPRNQFHLNASAQSGQTYKSNMQLQNLLVKSQANALIYRICSQMYNGKNCENHSFASIDFLSSDDWYKGDIAFRTNGVDGTANTGTLRMIIKSDGDIGINVEAPSELLHIDGNLFLNSDSDKIFLGAGKDSSIYYDGSNTYFNNEVGLGKFNFQGSINQTQGNLTGNMIYGEMWFHNDTDLFVVPLTEDIWNNITAFENSSSGGELNGFSNSGYTLVAQVSGLYKVDYAVSASGGVNDKYHFSIALNNVLQFNTESHRKIASGADIGSASGTGFIRLATNDQINVQTMNEDADTDVNLASVNINLVRIGN